MKIILYLLACVCMPAIAAPPLILAKEFNGQNVIGWAMSEKLDGVRAFWDGKQLISRQGYPFTPPPEFTRNFPPFAMDGELYSKRGAFEAISAAVRSHNGDWSDIRLHVFDVPHEKGDLYQRLSVAQKHQQSFPNVRFTVIKQIPIRNHHQVHQFLQEIERNGGEGVMLRNPNLPYTSGRSDGLLKLKSAHDDECTVTQHHQGKGKYAGKLGAISCKNQYGEFKIGSGFKDADRNNPPPIGSIITYRYRGFTQKGLPKFATFLRQRDVY